MSTQIDSSKWKPVAITGEVYSFSGGFADNWRNRLHSSSILSKRIDAKRIESSQNLSVNA